MSLNTIIKNLDIRKIKAPSGMTYSDELVEAANLLRDCIQSRIKQSTMSNVISTASIADVKVEDNKMTVTLKIKDSIRPSIFKEWNQKDANVFWLLNDGFTVKKHWYFDWAGKSKDKFVYREAAQWVRDGIAQFNSINRLGLKISEEHNVLRPLLYYGKIF